MICAFDLRRLALQMIGKRQTQRRHADHVEDPASFDVTLRLRIPLRQHDHGIARSFSVFDFCGKEPRVRNVVFGRRCLNGAGPGKLIAFETIIGDRRQSVKVFTCRHHARSVFTE